MLRIFCLKKKKNKPNIVANDSFSPLFFIAYVGKLACLCKDKLGSQWFPACTFWIILI